jgi:hypothetical protein
MASGFTNRSAFLILGHVFRAESLPTNMYLALVTNANVPDADTNVLGDLTEIAAGNGYTSGGYQLTPGNTDFDVHTEDDVNDRALLQIKDVVWTATGGPIPSSGAGARYAILTDDNASVAARQVYGFFDLVSDRTVSDTQPLTIQNCEFRGTN